MTSDTPRWGSLRRAVLPEPFARFALLSSIGCAAAFAIGTAFPQVSAIVAAITAITSIRSTLHDSMQSAFRQFVGTVLGSFSAFALVLVIGEFNAIALGISVLICFVLSWMLRINEEGAITIGITIILVAGGSMTVEAVETRFLGVIVGLLIAVILSLWTSKGTPTKRALDAALVQSNRIAALLSRISDALADRSSDNRVPASTVVEWLDEAQDIQMDLHGIQIDALNAVSGARWSPLMTLTEAEQVLSQVQLTESTVAIVVGMCRDLLIVAEDTQPLPAELVQTLSGMFGSLSHVVVEQAETAADTPAETLDEDATPLQELDAATAGAVRELKNLDETAPLLLGGSLLQDGEKIGRLMSGR